MIQAKFKNNYFKTQLRNVKKHKSLIPFLMPAALFTLVFSYIPMMGIAFAFLGPEFDLIRGPVLYNLFNSSLTLQNFTVIFDDPIFWRAIGNTLAISGIRLLLIFPLSIFIAIQLSELRSSALAKFVLIVICLPNFFSWAVVIGLWTGLLNAQGGALNEILIALRIIPPNYPLLQQDYLFRPFVIFFQAWRGAGWGSILFYAAIVSIDKTYYEAARIDGANKLQRIIHLTIPSILPTVALMLVLAISGIMDAGFEQIWTMMQNSAQFVETQVILGTYIFQLSVVDRTNIPFATALGVFNGLIALTLMLGGNFITRRSLKRGLW